MEQKRTAPRAQKTQPLTYREWKRRKQLRLARNWVLFLAGCALVVFLLTKGILWLLPHLHGADGPQTFAASAYNSTGYFFDADDARLVLVNANLPFDEEPSPTLDAADEAGTQLEAEAAQQYRSMAAPGHAPRTGSGKKIAHGETDAAFLFQPVQKLSGLEAVTTHEKKKLFGVFHGAAQHGGVNPGHARLPRGQAGPNGRRGGHLFGSAYQGALVHLARRRQWKGLHQMVTSRKHVYRQPAPQPVSQGLGVAIARTAARQDKGREPVTGTVRHRHNHGLGHQGAVFQRGRDFPGFHPRFDGRNCF